MAERLPLMRLFLDTEFIEDGKTIDLISIGLVAEDGREFYAENAEADLTKASPWVVENVLPHLWGRYERWMRGSAGLRGNRSQIRQALLDFVNYPAPAASESWVGYGHPPAAPEPPEFWAYYGDYDWVVTCQLFGTMLDLPKGWPKFCMDLKQMAVMLGNPELPDQAGFEHNALADARWNSEVFDFLTDVSAVCGPCSLDVHDDCHRRDGDACGCVATKQCGRALRVFEAKVER